MLILCPIKGKVGEGRKALKDEAGLSIVPTAASLCLEIRLRR